jgi:hypothetical protein
LTWARQRSWTTSDAPTCRCAIWGGGCINSGYFHR